LVSWSCLASLRAKPSFARLIVRWAASSFGRAPDF
jgi:hypothetical protein